MLVIGLLLTKGSFLVSTTALPPFYLLFLPVHDTGQGTSPCEGELKLGLRTSCVQSSMEEQIH